MGKMLFQSSRFLTSHLRIFINFKRCELWTLNFGTFYPWVLAKFPGEFQLELYRFLLLLGNFRFLAYFEYAIVLALSVRLSQHLVFGARPILIVYGSIDSLWTWDLPQGRKFFGTGLKFKSLCIFHCKI